MNTPRLYATFLLWLLSRAVRQAARGRRSRQAQAGVPVRRGAPAVQRRAHGRARPDRARDAPDPLQGRRRLLRHAEPGRRARPHLGAARQPHPARAAGLHAQGAEGRSAPPPRPSARTPSSTPSGPSRSCRWARRWCRCCTTRASRRSCSARWCARPCRASGRSTPQERQALIEADAENHKKYTQILDRESAHERLKARNTTVGQVKDKIRRFGNLFNLKM